MKIWIALLMFLGFCSAPSSVAAELEKNSSWDLGLEHAKSSLLDGFDLTGWGIISGGILATIVSHQQDHKVRDAWRDNQKMDKDFSKFGAVWGSGGPGLMIAATQLFVDRRNGLAHSESIILTSATHISIAALVRRGRPSEPASWTSFPSGHTSSAWATATSLSNAYGWTAAIPAYAAALITMGARISDDRHWLSDTVAGATLGLFWGRATHFHEQKPNSVSWIPFASHNVIGLGVRHEF
jgi:membrane-associated phospholipid phosphatase